MYFFAVSWSLGDSKLALSTVEAECMDLPKGVNEVIWQRFLLLKIGHLGKIGDNQNCAVLIKTDN
jgi:hypothetical protein